MGMLLTYRPGYFPGDALEDDGKREQVLEAGAHGDTPDGAGAAGEPDAYDDLSDEQVAEAYATNVGGNATSRKGQLRALRKLEDDSGE